MLEEKKILISKISEITKKMDYRKDPFLYYLPDLILTPGLENIDVSQAYKFVQITLRQDNLPIVGDALKILNRIIDSETGGLKVFNRDIFYENQSFFWKELGGYTKPTDVIMHIFNKTIFVLNIAG